MQQRIFVPMGGCTWSTSPSVLYCIGLGSCVAVCLYDEFSRTGCIAHIMLPFGDDEERPCFFANLAVKRMADQLRSRGIAGDSVWAKITGGANIFSGIGRENPIGGKNADSVRHWLGRYGIPVTAEDVGGSEGRNVYFDLEKGTVSISRLRKGTIQL